MDSRQAKFPQCPARLAPIRTPPKGTKTTTADPCKAVGIACISADRAAQGPDSHLRCCPRLAGERACWMRRPDRRALGRGLGRKLRSKTR